MKTESPQNTYKHINNEGEHHGLHQEHTASRQFPMNPLVARVQFLQGLVIPLPVSRAVPVLHLRYIYVTFTCVSVVTKISTSTCREAIICEVTFLMHTYGIIPTTGIANYVYLDSCQWQCINKSIAISQKLQVHWRNVN